MNRETIQSFCAAPGHSARRRPSHTGLPGAVHGCASMIALIFNDAPFTNFRELPLRRREAEMIYTLHRYLLNHGVTIIPHGMLLLSTAMTEDFFSTGTGKGSTVVPQSR